MSVNFFNIMEQIEAEANDLKFIEGSHSDLSSRYTEEATLILQALNEMKVNIHKDLKEKSKTTKPKKKKHK